MSRILEEEAKDATQETFLDVRFASSREYTFEVSAKGTEAAGEYHSIRLSVDGEVIGDQMLNIPDGRH